MHSRNRDTCTISVCRTGASVQWSLTNTNTHTHRGATVPFSENTKGSRLHKEMFSHRRTLVEIVKGFGLIR